MQTTSNYSSALKHQQDGTTCEQKHVFHSHQRPAPALSTHPRQVANGSLTCHHCKLQKKKLLTMRFLHQCATFKMPVHRQSETLWSCCSGKAGRAERRPGKGGDGSMIRYFRVKECEQAEWGICWWASPCGKLIHTSWCLSPHFCLFSPSSLIFNHSALVANFSLPFLHLILVYMLA